MIDDMLIGPIILNDHAIGYNCLDGLQNRLLKQIENVPLATQISIHLQHRAHAHYTQFVMQHLNDIFLNW
jgi:hypothetical protein